MLSIHIDHEGFTYNTIWNHLSS